MIKLTLQLMDRGKGLTFDKVSTILHSKLWLGRRGEHKTPHQPKIRSAKCEIKFNNFVGINFTYKWIHNAIANAHHCGIIHITNRLTPSNIVCADIYDKIQICLNIPAEVIEQAVGHSLNERRSLFIDEIFRLINFLNQLSDCFLKCRLFEMKLFVQRFGKFEQSIRSIKQRLHIILLVCSQMKRLNFNFSANVTVTRQSCRSHFQSISETN